MKISIKEKMVETLNQDQRNVLNYMTEKNIGTIFVDFLQRRIWPVEIRSDKNLAEKIMLEKTEIGNWAYLRDEKNLI